MNLFTTQKVRTGLALLAGGLIALAFASWLLGYEPVIAPLLVVASIVAGVPIAVRAWQALRVRAFSIDLLVTIAVVGALVIGEYVESAVVSFLFLFGAWLEARTLERTRASLRGLIELAPTRVTVLRGGERKEIDADDVQEGEQIVVVSGERVGVDGTVISGSALISEASITGEPTPARKTEGSRVYASTIVESGFVTVQADQVGDDTTYARIIELVEEAQESKTAKQRFLDRFSQYYTPSIVVGAVIAFLISKDLAFALTFLVIACPGALVISVPVAAVAGLGNVARNGVLAKDAEALESLALADTLVVDKTGTLTAGKPSVTAAVPAANFSEGDLLYWAGSVELGSEHHLGKAIVSAANEKGVILTEPAEVKVEAGLGISAKVGSRNVRVGSAKFMAAANLLMDESHQRLLSELADAGATPVTVFVDETVAGVIAVADPVRTEAEAALQQLRRGGLKQVVMLTGDRQQAGEAIGFPLGVDEVRGDLLPDEKAAVIRELQSRGAKTIMVGDGVNDAPALTLAEVGVAMGTAGTDVSVETADLVLLTDRLDQLAHARRVARKTVNIMKQNMVLALGTVALLIAGVLLDKVHLASGMLVHEASVLLVVLNALRLTTVKMSRKTAAQKHTERALAESV